jgi:hypothetical protein
MSNSSGPMNATCCDEREDFRGGDVDAALTVLSLMVFGLCSLLFIFASMFAFCRKITLAEMDEDVASQESEEEERKRKRKEHISKGLNIREWVPDNPPFESTGGDQDTPPSGETVAAPQPLAPPINSSPAACTIGSEDCESLVAWEEETADCAICLGPFRPQELVCESNNSACQHVFHKDCMVDWLMKHHDDCPMCREVYLLKTV